MKCFKIFIMATIAALFFLSILAGQEATPEQEKLVERLTVKNIEVPVRVMDGDKAVTDLTKDDFILLEGGEEMSINGFFVKRKRMDESAATPTSLDATLPATATEPPAPRTFVLVFQVTNFNDDLKKALDHLFDKILRPTDQIMVFANNSTRTFKNLNNPAHIKAILSEDFKSAGEAYRNRLTDYIRRIEDNLRVNDFTRQASRPEGDTRPQDLIFFLEKYLGVWEEYKKTYLLPRMDIFYNFSRYLENLKGEKWVLSFYQFEYFPRIKLQSDLLNHMREIAANMMLSTEGSVMALGNKLDQTLKEIYINMNMTRGFPMEEITRLFYKVDATFHSFFIRTQNPSFLQDFSYQTISTELEQVLQKITDATGGQNIASNKLDESLDKVKALEDIYYILTYRPKNPNKTDKIKIKLASRKGLTLLYDDNFRADYIKEYFDKLEKLRPQVKIQGFSFENKILAFKIHNFIKAKTDKNPQMTGQLAIRIRVMNQSENPVFDQTKMLTVDKDEMGVSIPAFKTLPSGDYHFLIDVVDQNSGLSDKIYESIKVK